MPNYLNQPLIKDILFVFSYQLGQQKYESLYILIVKQVIDIITQSKKMNVSQLITDIKHAQSDKNLAIIANTNQTQKQSKQHNSSASDSFQYTFKLKQNTKIQCQKCSSSNQGSICIKSENTSKVRNMTTEIDNSSFQNNQIKLDQSSIGSIRNWSNQGPNLSGQLSNVLISNSKINNSNISRFHVITFKREQCQQSQALLQEVEKSEEISSKQSTKTNTQSQRKIVRNSLQNSSKNTSESCQCKLLSFGFGKKRLEMRQPSRSDRYSQQFSLINVGEIEAYILQDGSPICQSETVKDLLKEMDWRNISILDRNSKSFQSQRNVSYQMQSSIQSAIVFPTINSKIELSYQQSKNPNQCPKKRKKIKKKNKSSYLANQRKYMNEIQKYFQCSDIRQLSNIDFLSAENIQIEISSEYAKQFDNEVCEWQTKASKYSEPQIYFQMQFD